MFKRFLVTALAALLMMGIGYSHSSKLDSGLQLASYSTTDSDDAFDAFDAANQASNGTSVDINQFAVLDAVGMYTIDLKVSKAPRGYTDLVFLIQDIGGAYHYSGKSAGLANCGCWITKTMPYKNSWGHRAGTNVMIGIATHEVAEDIKRRLSPGNGNINLDNAIEENRLGAGILILNKDRDELRKTELPRDWRR